MLGGRIGLAVIGVGVMGRWHAENAAWRIPEARLVAVQDARADVARAVAAELGCAAAGTLDELLARDDLDAVVIASPAAHHAEHAVAAARAGKDILLEKPMALRLEDCDRILDAAREIRLQVGFMRRYDAAYAEAHRVLRAGALGAPVLFKGTDRDREPAHLPASDGVTNMLLESAIHDFDAARWLLSDEVARVGTTAAALCHGGSCGHAPNAVLNTLEFARGALGLVETYRGARYGYDIRAEIVCAEGTLMVGGQREGRLAILTADGERRTLVPGFLERFADAYLAELRDFARGARERRPPAVRGADGRAAVAIALAGCEAFARHAPVEVR